MSGTQTLTRALDILFTIAEAGTSISVGEIAAKVSIPESTAYRLLQTLEKNGIVERKSKNQIGLGLKILDLARSLNKEMDTELCITADSIMVDLTKKVQETSVLMVRMGLNAICIKYVESKRLIRFVIEHGKVLPLHVSASGKAILAFESNKVREQILNNIDDEKEKKRLLSEIEIIRKQGYSVTLGEADKDVLGIGVPIYDGYGNIMASLTIAGPMQRLNNNDLQFIVKDVVKSAEDITSKLKFISMR